MRSWKKGRVCLEKIIRVARRSDGYNSGTRPVRDRKIGWMGKSVSLPSGNWAIWIETVGGIATALSSSSRLNLRTKRSFWCHGSSGSAGEGEWSWRLQT